MAKAEKTNHILVGLGGTGGKILRAFKMRMFEEFPEFEERQSKPVSLLYVDSTKEMMGIGRADFNVLGKDASFTENEFLYIKSIDVPAILDNIGNYPQLKGIVDNVSAVKTAIGSLGEAAGQKRRAGRLLFAANASKYVNALKNAYGRCNEISGNNSKVVHIFAGLCGGTGSGSIIDAIVQTRKLWDDAVINVYAMMPEKDLPKSDIDKGRYYENGYAALNELNALQCGAFRPHDVTGNGAELNLFSTKIKGVANGISIYSNANENGRTAHSFDELPKIVSDYVYSRVFLINPEAPACGDIIRAYNFENMDDFALELDETVPPSKLTNQEIPPIRTKKISSFGIKRVVYPEMRVLKHITYTVGKSVLDQFKYNNWRESQGFVNEEANKDYRGLYLNEDHLTRWMLDVTHLTLEKKVLPTDKDHKTFLEEWRGQISALADVCIDYDNPLRELENKLDTIYDSSFRGTGVLEYYRGKQRSLAEIAKEIRKTAEIELFNKWRSGEVSIVELSRVGELLSEYVSEELKKVIDKTITENKEETEGCTNNLTAIMSDWTNVGAWGKFITKKRDDYYAEYQEELGYYYTAKTKAVSLDFATQLVQTLGREIGALSAEINEFSKLISDAIDETNRLITSQRKVNKGLEDMKGAIVEVSEEESMEEFEVDLKLDKTSMLQISRQLREAIIVSDFISFGDLTTRISVESVQHAFDVTLSEIVKAKHADKPITDKKVLGLSILSQLKQKLDSGKKIQEFARDILEQSGAYLYLDHNQMSFNVRNNDLPDDNKNINLKETFISIPSPEENPELVKFAKELEEAFKSQSEQGRKKPVVYTDSPRKNELSIITISYCYPMRAITWMADYKKKYDAYLHTGNVNTDLSRAILLHSEGLGENLPPIFAFSSDELQKMDAEKEIQSPHSMQSPSAGSVPPPPPMGAATAPPVVPVEPQIQLFLYIGGQQYGPYDWQMCKQFVTTGQLTPQTMVWEQGMTAWTPAGQVVKLQPLFAPIPPIPDMPPMPPAGGVIPPPMM